MLVSHRRLSCQVSCCPRRTHFYFGELTMPSCRPWLQVSDSEIKWSMSRLPVFPRMLDAVCLAEKAGAQQAVVSDANTVSKPCSFIPKPISDIRWRSCIFRFITETPHRRCISVSFRLSPFVFVLSCCSMTYTGVDLA